MCSGIYCAGRKCQFLREDVLGRAVTQGRLEVVSTVSFPCDLMLSMYGKTGFCTQLMVNKQGCIKEISESIANVSV